jgi:hypothetical protein
MASRSMMCAGSALALLAAVPASAAHADDHPNGLLYQALGAPANWKISGTFRIRAEAIDGQFRPNLPDDDGLLSLRTTLFAEYDTGPVRIGAELFDSRGYLEYRRTSVGTSEINAFELGQAYLGFDLDSALGAGNNSTVTVGRFTMDDGSRRLIARNRFRNTINAFTGVHFEWRDRQDDRVSLFYALPHTRLPNEPEKIRDNDAEWDRESLHLRFFGGSLTKADVLYGGSLEVYVYRLYEDDTARFPTRNRRLVTPGIRLYHEPEPGRIDWDFEGVYQTGRVRASTRAADTDDLSVSAYFVHAEVGKTFKAPWSPRVALQYDRASGDKGNPNTYNRFDTLFGARRGEYGPTSLYGAVQRANLSSPGIRLSAKPNPRLDGFVAYRALWRVTNADSFASTGITERSGDSGKFAGQQVEARVRYWLAPKIVRLEMGAAYLFKADFLRHAPNAPNDGDTAYGYVDLTFNF